MLTLATRALIATTAIQMVAACAALAALFGATQDIAIDAWRIEVAAVERQGIMAAAYQWGYRIAMITLELPRCCSPMPTPGIFHMP